MSALPEEVVGLLSVHGPVRLEAGRGPTPVGAALQLAPLHRELFAFLRAQSPLVRAIEEHGEVSLTAEDPAGEYLIRVRARAAIGRSVAAEPRRAELMHWIPEGFVPQGTVTVHLHPFHLEFVRGKGERRMRAEGPVPGAALPPVLSRWLRLAREHVVLWYFAILGLDWLAVLVFAIDPHRGLVIAGLMILAGVLLLASVAILNQWAIYQRYREAGEEEGAAKLILEGWVPANSLLWVGAALALAGCILVFFLGAGEGWKVAVVAFLASGAPFFGPFFGVRHALRHEDREKV